MSKSSEAPQSDGRIMSAEGKGLRNRNVKPVLRNSTDEVDVPDWRLQILANVRGLIAQGQCGSEDLHCAARADSMTYQ